VVAHNSMGEKYFSRSHRSQPVTSERPCGRCRIDATADPCGPCPLYGSWLERLGLADDGGQRGRYAAWVQLGGWPLLWSLHDLPRRRDARLRLLAVLTAYPGLLRRWPAYPAMHPGEHP